MAADRIAKRWKELSGQKNWEDLVDPLDDDLRRYIIICGERTQAISDAIVVETKAADNYGFSRYPPEKLFANVGLQNGNPYTYTVTNFFYATSGIKIAWIDLRKSAWIGYVAVTTDLGSAALGRRDILVAWRGTMTCSEWYEDIRYGKQVSASDILPSKPRSLINEQIFPPPKPIHPKMHEGFHSVYTTESPDFPYNKTSARKQVLNEVRKLVDKYKDEKEVSITVTDHSLGGALATLNAMDIVANGYNRPTGSDKKFPVTAMVFGSPKVGDEDFKAYFDSLSTNLSLLRINNARDIVPTLPPELPRFYVHVGKELNINAFESKDVKTNLSPNLEEFLFNPHNLELYLYGVAGMQGEDEFKLVVKRDKALVNKGIDGLMDHCKVPAKWWVQKNHDMVQQDDGSWKLEISYMPPPPSA